MQKSALLTAALAAPLLLSFASNKADKISFAPAEGTVVTKTFTTTTTTDLDEMEVSMNGQPAPIGEMEMAMEMVQTVTVTDTYGKIADGRPVKLTRTYDAIGTEMDMKVESEMGGGQDMSGAGTSALEGSSVVFAWDGETGEYGTSFAEGEDGDADLLEGLTENMDLRGLLPKEELAAGDVYDIDLSSLVDVLAAGGDLKLDVEMDGESMSSMGPDPQMMTDFRQFFEDLLEGEATGKYVGMKDMDGVSVAVIELSLEINGSADMAELAGEMMGEELPEGIEMSIDRMDVEMSYEGTGELRWNAGKGVIHSLDLKADLGIDMEMEMAMDMGGQAMGMEMAMSMSGEVQTKVTTE